MGKHTGWTALRGPLFLASLVLLFCASPAGAVQQHGGAEGLVSHQIGHVLFIAGMAALLYRLHRNRTSGPGWFEFRSFITLIILWNCLTFSGHWIREIIDPRQFIDTDGVTVAFVAHSATDLVFYLSSLDNLLLVPAFGCLALALRRWSQQP